MSRRRGRGRSRDGLFVWTADGDTTPAEIVDNPRARPCPVCGVAAMHGCVSRTRRRTPLADYHPARKTPQETT